MVRLDVGDLADFLADRPLEELQLTVSGLLDPVQRGQDFTGAVPSVRPAGCQITRGGLLGRADLSGGKSLPLAYQRALGRIVWDLRHGELPVRMAAARRTASLLCFVERLQRQEAKLPGSLAGVVNRPVLLSILRAVLADGSPVVRAEMLASLGRVRLDAGIGMLLGEVFEDASPLVRFRAAELMGISDSSGNRAVLEQMARDPDELVALMAGAFSPAGSEKQTGPDRID
jgi:hypothetical protein